MDEDIDGMPMPEEDIDGVPIAEDDDLDGIPMEIEDIKHIPPAKLPTFKTSSWSTVRLTSVVLLPRLTIIHISLVGGNYFW